MFQGSVTNTRLSAERITVDVNGEQKMAMQDTAETDNASLMTVEKSEQKIWPWSDADVTQTDAYTQGYEAGMRDQAEKDGVAIEQAEQILENAEAANAEIVDGTTDVNTDDSTDGDSDEGATVTDEGVGEDAGDDATDDATVADEGVGEDAGDDATNDATDDATTNDTTVADEVVGEDAGDDETTDATVVDADEEDGEDAGDDATTENAGDDATTIDAGDNDADATGDSVQESAEGIANGAGVAPTSLLEKISKLFRK